MFVLFSTPSDRNVRFSIRKNRFSIRIFDKVRAPTPNKTKKRAAPRCAKLSPTLHGFPLCSSLSSSLATAKQRHHHQQQRRHHDSTLGSLGSHSAFHVLERCSKGTRWGFIIADLPTLLRCHSLGSHMPRWGATCHMLGVQRVRCGANTAWVSSSLGVLSLRCGCHAGRKGTRWGMT